MPKHIFIILISMFILFSCNGNVKNVKSDKQVLIFPAKKQHAKDSLSKLLKTNIDVLGNLLKGRKDILQDYMSRYQIDTCGILPQNDSILKADFEGIKVIKGITKNKIQDTIFVMPTFNYCDDGESYCFFDKSIPRLYTDSYCCHPNSFFVLPDIDDDGVREVGIYYSSCTSRFKSLKIYTLKGKIWKQLAASTFDTFTQDPDKVQFETLVKKISKGKFRICNFNDGQKTWDTVTFK